MIKLKTDSSVEVAINYNPMTVIYFTGNACGACEVIKDKIENILKKYPKIKSYEVNGEENIKIASQYQVFSLPVFLLFVDGKESIRAGRYVDLLGLERSINRYYSIIF